ncbi:AAA family ATPase [Sphingomonas sp.]|uniref:AAA family ATPase n=1 Tax=Sphingomonas sp. TaxID=28214 RepID=UPI002EDA8948
MTKPLSLLERAAQVYDFGEHARARAVQPTAVDAWAAPAVADALPDTIPAEFRARPAVDAAVPEEYRAPAEGEPAHIDRLMLAERGMIVPGAPVGPLAEEFRLVKRQLLITRERIAGSTTPDKARSILVCSARPGEGKTFCSINLALSLAAERDTEVLLIDADFAKPDIMAQFGLDDSLGLLDAIADPALDPESLVVETDVPHLSILPAGSPIATDTELLASARTRAVIARLLAANPRRLLIFDSPPALAASPASVLAMLVGQVMLVVRADTTPEDELRDAVSLLDGCDHIALVLNAVSFVPGGARFGTYYGQEDRT